MRTIDRFLIRELFKTFRKSEVAYVIDDIQPYKKALASVRMQCYDMIEWFENEGIKSELYRPLKKYKAVFFIKTRSDKSLRIAKELYAKKVPMFMYAYYEAVDDDSKEKDWERKNILQFVKMMKTIAVVGEIQEYKFRKYHHQVVIVGDSVHKSLFKVQKEHEKKERVTLIYCGYYRKAKDLLCIKDVLKKMQKKYECRLIILTDRDPEIKELSYYFVKYNQSKIAEQLTLGDIMIAPRKMQGVEELSHSNTKIAYPMAVGLPVIASPLPSYEKSPAILCNTQEEWCQILERLIENWEERKLLGDRGRNYIQENYSIQHIGKLYKEILERG